MIGWRDIARALLLVGLLAAWNATSDKLYEVFDADRAGSPLKLPLILLGTLVTYGGILALGCVRWGQHSLSELGWSFIGWPRLIGVALLLTIAQSLLVFGAYAYMAGSEGVASLAAAVAGLSSVERLFYFVMGAKVALLEETLFRGDLLHALRGRVSALLAVLGSSMVFALYHRDLTPLPLLMKVVFGVMFAVATLRTRSIIPATIAHTAMWTIFANN